MIYYLAFERQRAVSRQIDLALSHVVLLGERQEVTAGLLRIHFPRDQRSAMFPCFLAGGLFAIRWPGGVGDSRPDR